MKDVVYIRDHDDLGNCRCCGNAPVVTFTSGVMYEVACIGERHCIEVNASTLEKAVEIWNDLNIRRCNCSAK